MMRRALSISLLVQGAILSSCKAEDPKVSTPRPEETPKDAGSAEHLVSSKELGFDLAVPRVWTPTAEVGSQALFDARRSPGQKPWTVPPRFAITSEPTEAYDVESAARATIAAIKSSLESTGAARMDRTSMLTRFVGDTRVVEVELGYEVKAPEGPRSVVHRSLLALVGDPGGGGRSLLTLTATYLVEDQGIVGDEVRWLFANARFSKPAPGAGARDAGMETVEATSPAPTRPKIAKKKAKKKKKKKKKRHE